MPAALVALTMRVPSSTPANLPLDILQMRHMNQYFRLLNARKWMPKMLLEAGCPLTMSVTESTPYFAQFA